MRPALSEARLNICFIRLAKLMIDRYIFFWLLRCCWTLDSAAGGPALLSTTPKQQKSRAGIIEGNLSRRLLPSPICQLVIISPVCSNFPASSCYFSRSSNWLKPWQRECLKPNLCTLMNVRSPFPNLTGIVHIAPTSSRSSYTMPPILSIPISAGARSLQNKVAICGWESLI